MTEPRALVKSMSSRKQTRAARALEKRREAQLTDDITVVLSTDAGVRVFHELLNRWSAFRSIYAPDPLPMAYAAGKQDIAHELMLLCDRAPGAYARIMAERDRARAEVASLNAQRTDDTEGDDDDDS